MTWKPNVLKLCVSGSTRLSDQHVFLQHCRMFMWVCILVCLPTVSRLQRAQAQCLAVVGTQTGAARWKMKRWGGTYTETCSGNRIDQLTGLLLSYLKLICQVLLTVCAHYVQLQEEDTGCRGHSERAEDLFWLLWEVCLLLNLYDLYIGHHAVDYL